MMTKLTQINNVSNRNMIVVNYNVLAKCITQTTIRNIKSKVERILVFFIAVGNTKQLEKENNDTTTLCDKHESNELKWVSENVPEKYKNTLEEVFTSNKLNIDTKEYICQLEHNKYKLQHKTDSSLNVDIVGNNNVKH